MIPRRIRSCLQALLIASMVVAASPSFAQDTPANPRAMIKPPAAGHADGRSPDQKA